MNTNTMITIRRTSNNLLAITTYSRDAGKHGRFLILRDNLEDWAGNPSRSYYEEDCGSFIRIDFYKEEFHVKLTWISFINSTTGTFKGIQQNFTLTPAEFYGLFALDEDESVRFLRNPNKPEKVTLDFAHAGRTLHRIADSDKAIRRAFCKAVRDQLNGWKHTRTFYNDGGLDFFWRDNDGLCGGLIFSTYEKRGHVRHMFTIHT